MSLLADKVGCVVGVAGSLVHRFLWIGAQRPRKRDTLSWHAVHIMSCDDACWRDIVFNPLHQRREHVEYISAGPTTAVVHPRHHEEPVILRSPLLRLPP